MKHKIISTLMIFLILLNLLKITTIPYWFILLPIIFPVVGLFLYLVGMGLMWLTVMYIGWIRS